MLPDGLTVDVSPFVEAARTAEVASAEKPPQAFGHGAQQLVEVFRCLKYLLRPPDADDAAKHEQYDVVDHIQKSRPGTAGP